MNKSLPERKERRCVPSTVVSGCEADARSSLTVLGRVRDLTVQPTNRGRTQIWCDEFVH